MRARSGFAPAVPSLVVHIPHASVSVPRSVRRQFVVGNSELRRELLRMTDHFTDELFAFDPHEATSVVYPVSRLVADPERFTVDSLEPMAARGMGMVYTCRADGTPLRSHLDLHQRRRLIRDYYRPHHDRLRKAVARSVRANGWCLILDAHSFPSVPLPYELHQAPSRPDYCVGTDPFHTPAWLARGLPALLRRGGQRVAINRPFGGTIVPRPYYQRDPRVLSVMVEVNRDLYMDERRGRRTRQFVEVRQHLVAACSDLVRLATRRMAP